MSTSTSSDVPLPLPAAPTWFSRLYQDDEFEELDNIRLVKLMPLSVRKLLWRYSGRLLGLQNSRAGVSSQACRVLERYCSGLIMKDLPEDEWQLKIEELKQRFTLWIGASLMLASKMDSNHHINARSLKRLLESCGKIYSFNEIIATECMIFMTIGYRLPLWTNVQKVQMIVTQFGVSSYTIEGAGLFMDMVDLMLPLVFEEFKKHAIVSPSSAISLIEPGPSSGNPHGNKVYIRNTHLIAGVVVATLRYMHSAMRSPPDVTPTVACWSRAPVHYIRSLGNVIFQFVMELMEKIDRMEKMERMDEKERKRRCDPKDRSDKARECQAKRNRFN